MQNRLKKLGLHAEEKGASITNSRYQIGTETPACSTDHDGDLPQNRPHTHLRQAVSPMVRPTHPRAALLERRHRGQQGRRALRPRKRIHKHAARNTRVELPRGVVRIGRAGRGRSRAGPPIHRPLPRTVFGHVGRVPPVGKPSPLSFPLERAKHPAVSAAPARPSSLLSRYTSARTPVGGLMRAGLFGPKPLRAPLFVLSPAVRQIEDPRLRFRYPPSG